MKKILKKAFIILLCIIGIIDIYGFWKYKLKKNDVSVSTTETAEDVAPSDVETPPVEQDEYANKTYTEITSKNIASTERLYITAIEVVDNGKYEVRGVMYKEYEITSAEYKSLNSGEQIEIFGKQYTKESISNGNMKLKCSEAGAEDVYVKYNTSTKKYTLKSSKNDYAVYESEEKYVKLSVSGTVIYNTNTNGRKSKLKISEAAVDFKPTSIKDTSQINLSTFTFSKKGVCTEITEITTLKV